MINRCIGCYHYDDKENVCVHGSPIFIDDTCTDYQDNEFVKQIRTDDERDFQNSEYWNDFLAKVIADAKADVIDKCIEIVENEKWNYSIIAKMEQLKEKND